MTGANETSVVQRAIWLGLVLAILAVVAAGIYRLTQPAPEPLPVLGTIPDFTLIERDGRQVTAADLRGRPWVADFIFTRCGGICPVLSSALEQVQTEVAAHPELGARLVSFSVDPAHDRPEVLRAYAERFHAGPDWLFLTGEAAEIYTVVRDGFRLSVAASPPEADVDPGELVTHSDRLVVVDASLRVRSYHHGTDLGVAEAVVADLVRLRGGARRPLGWPR